MKLYTRDEVLATDELVKELMTTLLDLMKEHIDTYMPGFTHLQKAQPVTLAHHIGAFRNVPSVTVQDSMTFMSV